MEILYKPQTTFSLTFEVIHHEAVINAFQDLIRFAVFFHRIPIQCMDFFYLSTAGMQERYLFQLQIEMIELFI
jgi:hypothetical protein